MRQLTPEGMLLVIRVISKLPMRQLTRENRKNSSILSDRIPLFPYFTQIYFPLQTYRFYRISGTP